MRATTGRTAYGDQSAAAPAESLRIGRLTSPVLIDRDEELRLLAETVDHPPSLAVIEGEAGVGKTRLVQELLGLRELRGVRVLVGGCQALREPYPLGPVIEALHTVERMPQNLSPAVGSLGPLLPELAELLPDPPPTLADPLAERHRLHRAIRELLEALGTCVLILEDLHWADAGTSEFLRFVASAPPERLAVVMTYRREDLPRGSPVLGIAARPAPAVEQVHLSLTPLGPTGVGRLVGAVLQAEEVSEEFARFLHERSGGIPFAVEEDLRLLQEHGDVYLKEGGWSRRVLGRLQVPAAIRNSVMDRLGRLPVDAVRLVEAVACLGSAPEELLLQVGDLPEAKGAAALCAALDAVVLQERDGRYGFRHALAQQAVHESIPLPRRRRLHLAAARALEEADPKPVARLAHHFREAGETRAWVVYAEAAAEQAASLGNDAGAFTYLADVLDATQVDPVTRARLAIEIGDAAYEGLRHAEAIPILRRILEEDGLERDTRGQVRLRLGRLYSQAGDVSAGGAEIERAAEELETGSPQQIGAFLSLALPVVPGETLAGHERWLERARHALPSDDGPLHAAALAHEVSLRLAAGDPRGWDALDTLLAVPRHTTDRARSQQVLRGLTGATNESIHLGHLSRARSLLSMAEEISEELRFERWHAGLAGMYVLLEWLEGRWEGLEDRARMAVEETEPLPLAAVDAQLPLAMIRLSQGRVRLAIAELEHVAEVTERGGSPQIRIAALAGAARAALRRGSLAGGWALASRALDLVQMKGIWAWAGPVLPVAIDAMVGSGRQDGAEKLVRSAERGLRGKDAPAARAALLTARALVRSQAGDAAGAARALERAARRWEAMPCPYEAAAARERAGELLLEGGTPEGEPRLRAALASYGRLGATGDVARVRNTLRQHGLAEPQRRGRRGYGRELSPREREIADMAAAGNTNPEIAEALYLSRRTVENTLARAMRKLGISSRKELAGSTN